MMHKMIKRPLIVFLISVMLVISGLISLFILPIKLQPTVNVPFLMVTAQVDTDTDMDDLEKNVAIPLETAAMNSDLVNQVDVITDTQGVRMQVILKDTAKDEEINKVEDTLTDTLNTVSMDLDHQEVRQYSTSDQVIMVMAFTSEHPDQAAVRRELKDEVVSELRSIPGVKSVEHPFDDFDPEYIFKLREDHLTSLQQASQIVDEIRSNFTTPLLGSLQYNGESFRVKSEASITNEEELSQLRLSTGERLYSLVDVETEKRADHYLSEMNGERFYEMNVYADETASEVKISRAIRKALDQLHADQHTQWDYVYAWDSADFIGAAVKELAINILIGAVVASLILLLVFRSIRTMMVIAFSIPICVFTTFLSLSVFGFSLNIVTLMGIGLGTGMIVDACIVVIENIFRKLQEGYDRMKAVTEGTKEVIAPVFSSVLTTVAVFLPVSFLEGMIGQFMAGFAITITVALLSSLAVAVTIIPILSSRMIKLRESNKKKFFLQERYGQLLTYFLHRKWRTLFSFIMVFILAMYALLAFVPKNFVPNVTDRSLFINFEVEENIDYDLQKDMMRSTARNIQEIDGVQDVLYLANKDAAHQGTFIILYDPIDEMNRSDEEVSEDIKQQVDVDIPYSSIQTGMGQGDTSGQMSISLTSSSMASLVESLPNIKEQIMLFHGVTGVETGIDEGSAEWTIDFSNERLSHYGMSRQEVEQYLRLVLSGVQNIEFKMNGEDRIASVQFPEVYRQSSDALYQIPIREDIFLTVDDVADLYLVTSESERKRRDGDYQTTVNIHFEEEHRAQLVQSLTQYMSSNPNDEVKVDFSGTQQQQAEGVQDLLITIGVSFATVFIILTVQFNRLRQPFLIMVSLPFAMIGVSLGFLITGRNFDIMAMIGIVLLVGIVVNNAIVLIDFINKQRDKHEDLITAIVKAAELRLRPILTTTMTTIGGLIPLFIGGTSSSDFQTPIATAIIFGLLFSTLVTLIIVPIFYLMFEGKKKDKKHKKHTQDEAVTESF